ncbi:MAG TPA: SDR family NAD(P)-dependent oxidoreductase, partial [Kofleriaceae bacterium]|nr:SDR family NAD(P)-dependent oxidoreductase [Kofleriaceae bacterium]
MSTAPPLLGTTAVITGASRGIGRAIAKRLAEAGADLALWARDRKALEAVANEVAARGRIAQVFEVDVTDSAAVDAARDRVRATMPAVRTLVNNAGAVLRSETAKIGDADWAHVMAVNANGTFYVTRAFLPDLLRAHGRIINIASRAGREGTPLLAAYCAAKHAVVGFTRALAEELRAGKVSVNAVCPGSVDTDMLRLGLPDASPDMTPDDIARTVEFL